MRWFVVCLVIAGCARAGERNHIVGGIVDGGVRSDADDFPEPDASPIDAAPGQLTLSQTTSGTITLKNSFACADNSLFTFQNSYYRVFRLADFNITSTLHVTQVDFGIQTATAGSGTQQPARVNLGTYAGTPQGTTLDLAQVRSISSADIQIPNGSGTRMTVPITGDIAATTSVIVELAIPDGTAAGNKFFVGSNAQGERSPGYTRATDCQFNSPTTMQSIADQQGFGQVSLVMTVTGQTVSAAN
jgi:hypothetical protein